MSNLGLAGLIMAYVVLATFLLGLHLHTNWTWWVKAGATITIAIFYFVTYFSIPQMLGWPTSYGLPEKFRLISYNIKDNENIYIWAIKIQSGTEHPKPRAYVLPYTTGLHNKVEEAGQRMKTGRTIIGQVDEMSSSPPPKTPVSLNRLTEQLNVTFEDAPTSGNFRKE